MIDLYGAITGTLYKVKGGSSRSSVRQAIGELLDLVRQSPEPGSLAILLPERPHKDLVALVSSVNMGIAYADGSGGFQFVDERTERTARRY